MARRKPAFKPVKFAWKICQEYTLIYKPNDSMYDYLADKGYWQPIHSKYVEKVAMEMLGDEAKSGRLSDIRKLVETACVIAPGRDFNENNGFVNLHNGMLNIATRELQPHDKDYLSTIQLKAKYNSQSTCPRWEKFLEEVLDEDVELIDLVQEFMGYSLVPDTRFEKALLMVGEGANGKSTLIRDWEELVGPENISSVTLTNLQNEFHRVTLQGKLLNIAAEINPKTLEQSDYFKRIVTGDTIDAAHKGKPVFEFRPFSRLVFAMNRMPRVKDTSYGFYRRLLMVSFNRMFEGDEADRELSKKLLTELDGIFLWALKGLDRLYQNNSFVEPASVKKAVDDYKRVNNPLVAFVEDTCELDPEANTGKDTLYSEYKKYTENYGYAAGSKDTFFKELYAAYPELKAARLGPRGDRERTVEGVKVVRRI